MSKSKPGDGRRGNRPPDKHKIRPGEIRNPYGRRGKKGPAPISEVDRMLLKHAQRIVSHDENGDVTALERLVQEEYHAALPEKDAKARVRLLERLSAIQAALKQELNDNVEFYFTCKDKYSEIFADCEARGKEPPDVAHPSHVELRDGELVFTGPMDSASRKEWEGLKGSIKVCDWLHARARQDWKLKPTEEHWAELKRIEKHRRQLMRSVPHGWNWREEIYCLYSRAKFVRDTIAMLEKRS